MALPGYRILLIALLVANTACSTLPPSAKNYDSFSAYAEAVFRHQNKLTSRLMMLNGSEAIEDNSALLEAEQAMNDACRLLNEYAVREMDGTSMSLFFKRSVQASIEECDERILELETVLAEID